ncbi:MAG TPA: DUF5996 family protein [Thermoanaerobaculia bacterium]|nr:DUF5996 family protein [Thermoanaerobaculia bacterium]
MERQETMNVWPSLPLEEWRDTRNTIHRWMQVVGKIKMKLTPLINHWWNVVLYVSARGLTTAVIPYGDRWFDMEFDFIDHVLRIRVSDGSDRTVPLAPRTVRDFHDEVFAALRALNIHCSIWTTPVECDNPIPLDTDEHHRAYDVEYVRRFWKILALSHAVLTEFRAEFNGKCSPVHFFWGGFDLAVTRFSGRPAPPRENADAMNAEAYSHEVSSVGWWPGDDSRLQLASFYSYGAPEPAGYRTSLVSPSAAYYNEPLGGFYLHHDELVKSADPDKTLLEFCRSTYEAAAIHGKWDRALLERPRS